MNENEYIQSGIAESYVMGLLDESDKAKFERMCKTNPELKDLRTTFELDLQKHALENTIEAPLGVKHSIFEKLGLSTNDDLAPVLPITTLTHSSDNKATPIQFVKRLRFTAIAATVLLIVSIAINFYYFKINKALKDLNETLVTSNQTLVTTNASIKTQMNDYKEYLSVITDTGMAIIRMLGSNVETSPAPSSNAIVYWNKQSKNVYLNASNLPQAPKNKQYQLWALVNGIPVDAGIFDVDTMLHIVKMKNMPSADAFAVTLENIGGSPTPTMEQLYLLGKV